MTWPPKANWPPRDWYDWGMTLAGIGCVVVCGIALKQIIIG